MSDHRPVKVWQERPGEMSWECSCGMVHKHRPFGALVCVDEAEEIAAERLELVSLKHDGKASREDLERLAARTRQLADLYPPVGEEALRALEDSAGQIVDADSVLRRIRTVVARCSAQGWSADWPTEPGWFWFYGYRSEFSVKHGDRELVPVDARRGATDLFFVASGAFLYRSEGARGLWLPMDVPELPREREE